ncbi:glutathione transferase GstA [Raoultella terrigena]|uniref:glutathione transferase GstA n=1 Tax=Raoultella terrigena TaxID=577 RepID=UPI002F951361
MKLYYSPGSCSLSPHIALREAGLDFELIHVDTKTHTWGAGNNYYDINSLGYVPALETADGDIFREGVTLIQYIADLVPAAGLAPASGTLARYRLEEWLVFFNSEIHKAFIPLFYSEHGGAYINIAREKLLSRFAWLDQQLADKAFITGAQFSIADGYLFALVGWAQAEWLISVYNLDIDLTDYKNIAAWYQRVLARPAVRQALKEEGIDFLPLI